MKVTRKQAIKALIDVGNTMGGQKITGKTQVEKKKSLEGIFANARRRIKEADRVG